ncbi:MAG: hypothetical protein V3T81_04885 [Thermoanaerobaculia bacterium]
MVTKDDIASFIERLDGGAATAKEVEDSLWVVDAGDSTEVVVHYADPVAILRVRVMEVPTDMEKRTELFRQLLELNARELVHGSYGIEGDHIVWTDTLELENLDYNEFESSYDSVSLALASHLGTLAPFGER